MSLVCLLKPLVVILQIKIDVSQFELFITEGVPRSETCNYLHISIILNYHRNPKIWETSLSRSE